MSAEPRAESPNPSETEETKDESNPNELVSRRTFVKGAGVAAATVAAGTGAAAAASDPAWNTGRSGLDFASDYVQNPYFAESTLTKAKHRQKWGTTLEALEAWENDSGNKDQLPGYVPTTKSEPENSTDNVVTLRADKVEAPDLYNFPRGEKYDEDGDGSADADVYALDATHWSTTGATNGSVSVTNADLAVKKSLNVATSNLADTETVKATFTDVAVTDDVSKAFFQGVINVNSIGANALVELVLRDDDGDEKIMTIDPGGDASTAKVIATGSGNGYVFQQRIGDLATGGSGDGTFDSVQEVEVRVSASGGASDADVTLTAFNAEKPAKWTFGSWLKNEGTDSETREKRVRPGPGTFTVTSLDTMSSELKATDAVIYDVEYPFRWTMKDSEETFEYRFVEATDYPGYDWRLQVRGRQRVITGYDLTHTGLTYKDYVSAPASRYVEVWTASGTENTDFSDISDSSKTSHGGKYDSRNTVVDLVSSPSAGIQYTYYADLLLTGENRNNAEASTSGGGGAPPASQKNSGLFTGIMALVGGSGLFLFIRRLLR